MATGEDRDLYNKLFTRILDSSIWLEDDATRIVWITLLAVMDEDGLSRFASVANIARRAKVSYAAAAVALKKFESPDPLTLEAENHGRRIERVPGGWIVLNADKYRGRVTGEETRKQDAERARRYRARKRTITPERDAVGEAKMDIKYPSRKQVRDSIAAAVKETVERARALAATHFSSVAVAPLSASRTFDDLKVSGTTGQETE
jgi:hypothetical protein